MPDMCLSTFAYDSPVTVECTSGLGLRTLGIIQSVLVFVEWRRDMVFSDSERLQLALSFGPIHTFFGLSRKPGLVACRVAGAVAVKLCSRTHIQNQTLFSGQAGILITPSLLARIGFTQISHNTGLTASLRSVPMSSSTGCLAQVPFGIPFMSLHLISQLNI